jgi:tetratricopeptide (TPR) repeat protein
MGFWFVYCSGSEKNERNTSELVSTIANIGAGRDAIEFGTYEQMVNTAPTKPFDIRAELLIEFVDARILDGGEPEDNDVWEALLAMTPYRKTKEVQDALTKWALLVAKRISNAQVQSKESGTSLKTAAAAYKKLDFSRSAGIYVNVLRKQPGNLDVRNDLALVCMHQCNDPAAMLELQITVEVKRDYLPGLINLTVVFERLGSPSKARETARRALIVQPLLPAAAVNAAWFENVSGDHAKAKRILSPVVKLDTCNKSALNLYLQTGN